MSEIREQRGTQRGKLGDLGKLFILWITQELQLVVLQLQQRG